jgi:hypothetical protein
MRTSVKLTAASLAAAVGLSAIGAGTALASSDGRPSARPSKTAFSHERSSRDRSRDLRHGERSSRDGTRLYEKSSLDRKGSHADASLVRES